jgi:hypothetical protein
VQRGSKGRNRNENPRDIEHCCDKAGINNNVSEGQDILYHANIHYMPHAGDHRYNADNVVSDVAEERVEHFCENCLHVT